MKTTIAIIITSICLTALLCMAQPSVNVQTSNYRANHNHPNESSIVITAGGGMTNTSHDVHTTSGVYRVDYRFNSSFWSTPLTYPPGDPHHDATINVIKDGVYIGKPISGTYVNGICKMCDDPLAYVQRAIEEEEKLKAIRVWTNFNNSMPLPAQFFTPGPAVPKIQPFATFTNEVFTVYSESQITGKLMMDNPNAPINWLRLNVEIGFRPDGTVIWRAIK